MTTKNWRSFEEARIFAQSLQLNSCLEWHCWLKKKEKPPDIPSSPNSVYANKGWKGWGDWLGTYFISSKKRKYRPFSEARLFIRQLHFKNSNEFKEWGKTKQKPEDISTTPEATYKETGWISWNDFLGANNICRTMQCRPFEEARKLARSLHLKSRNEWKLWSQNRLKNPLLPPKPEDIPYSPDIFYKKKGWLNWSDWLGTNTTWTSKDSYRPFKKARQFARSLEFETMMEWKAWTKGKIQHPSLPEKPKDIPNDPSRVYEDQGWVCWGDWLGTGRKRRATSKKQYLPFEEAREYVQQLNLKTSQEWYKWATNKKRPQFIPSHPPRTYKKEGWKGFGDWLGTGRIALKERKYKSFNEAREFVHSLKIPNAKKWKVWAKSKEKPEDIPSAPNTVYKEKGWLNWNDWLGNEFRY